jgi:hypothetical protein
MLRTQVQFTEAQARRLRSIARREGISVAELVRRSVDRALRDEASQPHARYERAARLVGTFHDRERATDLSRKHDDHLTDAFE